MIQFQLLRTDGMSGSSQNVILLQVPENVREEHDKGKDKYGREKDRVRERDSEDHHKRSAADNHNHDMADPHGKERRRSGRDGHNRHRERHNSLRENETDHYKELHKAGGGHKKSREQVHLVHFITIFSRKIRTKK